MSITRKGLAKILSEKAGLKQGKSVELIDEVFAIMQETLEKGENIKITGFGNFIVRKKRARIGRNPRTGQKVEISARRVVKFKPTQVLRKTLGKGDK